ncbi:hypothetical protein NC653_025746 [Populus alba x Populus x berolinensis]|uniref:Uncharacterized protein n=1 Tax=Populus alba x Populus x berolinensis TaxID=444605 RepID=A0AAD6MC02_9ROSI|nr:hypothetical protein NC653_025744 [Populus alba x Populus x berolinensis]KAJ6982730.1 hypothetical protein NC653_025746 [Populus alba x Populus x berolinensis]
MQRREPGKKGVLPRGCLAWQQPINWEKKLIWRFREEQHEKQWQGQFFPMEQVALDTEDDNSPDANIKAVKS